MRYIIPVVLLLLAGLVQLTFPASLVPGNLVIDVALIGAILISLIFQPTSSALWLALIPGLMVDLWQPAHFGVWTLACFITALVVILVNTKVLPRLSWPGLITTAGLGLLAGYLVLFGASIIDADLTIGQHLLALLRIYLLRLPLDLIAFVIGYWAVKKGIKVVNPAANA